jgi:dihydropteroate synthase
MMIKHFRSREEFYRFLKERIGVFFKEAEERSFEGIFHCLYFEYDGDPAPIFSAARRSCLRVFREGKRFALTGRESDFRDFCSLLTAEGGPKELSIKIIKTLMNYRRASFQLRYNAKILPLGLKTAIMGVLNVTPDSFSDGGLYIDPRRALRRGVEMFEEGAEIIDVGGESTRPGSERITEEEELRRVLPVVKALRKELPDAWISVDTYKSSVAEACLEEGADIINDVSGGTWDPKMKELIARWGCPYVINHIKGRPESWRTEPILYEDVMGEIISWIRERIGELEEAGLKDRDNLIVDPGIGFGKLPEHNAEILRRLGEMRILGRPILIGVSRKSFVGAVLESFLGKKTQPKERLYGSLGATAYAVVAGAHIVRTHDVRETREFLALLDAVRTVDAV